MFLSESYVTEQNDVMGYDPVYAMQIMQEATDDWNDICMKMIKLEHTAIMREDAELLKQGAKEAIARFKVNLNTLGKKLLEFLERVRIQWQKIQVSVSTKFLGNKKQAILKAASGNDGSGVKEKKVTGVSAESLNASLETIKTFATETVEIGKLFASDWGTEASEKAMPVTVKSKIEKLEGKWKIYEEKVAKAEKATTTITTQLVATALEIIEKRPAAIKNIETMKKIVVATEKEAIKALEDKNEKATGRNRLVELQRVFNRQIIEINKTTNQAIKVCRSAVVNESTKKADDTKSNTSGVSQDQADELVKKLVGGATMKESVLDLFS